MKIKGITILKSYNPVVIKEKPSKRTIEDVAKLASNPQFVEMRKLMRKVYGLPENGYDLSKLKPSNDKRVEDKIAMTKYTLILGASALRGKVDLADDFIPQLLLMFFFNAIIDFDDFKGFVSRPIRFIVGKANIASAMFNYPYEIGAILLPYSVTKNKFKDWVKENWSPMMSEIEKLPDDPMGGRIHKKWLLALDIIHMRDQKKRMSFPDIAAKLIDMYPDDDKVTDEAYVKKVYFDYKKIIDDWTQFSK